MWNPFNYFKTKTELPRAYLFRNDTQPDCVRGVMVFPDSGKWFYTLEPPWRNNERNISCIPTGEYRTSFLPRSSSGKYRNVYHVLGVDERSGILIHNGNIASHTKGCIIMGKRKGQLDGRPAVLNSRSALTEIHEITGKSGFILEIY